MGMPAAQPELGMWLTPAQMESQAHLKTNLVHVRLAHRQKLVQALLAEVLLTHVVTHKIAEHVIIPKPVVTLPEEPVQQPARHQPELAVELMPAAQPDPRMLPLVTAD